MDRYYTYLHTVNDIPFYVGKGCDNRYKHERLRARSKEWHAVVKDNFSSSIIASGSEEEMLELEKNLIKRLCGLGFNLVNKVHNPNYEMSEVTRKAIAKNMMGEKNPMFGKPANNKGKATSEETKEKMRLAMEGSNQSEAHTLTLMLSKITNGKAKGYSKSGNKYYARIKTDGKLKCLGFYDTPEEAHQVFLKANAEKIATIQARLAELQARKVA